MLLQVFKRYMDLFWEPLFRSLQCQHPLCEAAAAQCLAALSAYIGPRILEGHLTEEQRSVLVARGLRLNPWPEPGMMTCNMLKSPLSKRRAAPSISERLCGSIAREGEIVHKECNHSCTAAKDARIPCKFLMYVVHVSVKLLMPEFVTCLCCRCRRHKGSLQWPCSSWSILCRLKLPPDYTRGAGFLGVA